MSTATLITGCSTGFGRDAAERLARRGHTVFATMRDVNGRNRRHREALEALAARERLALAVLELDVTDDASVQQAVAAALDLVDGLDAVINNAGFGGVGVTEAYTPEQFHRMFDTNLYGVVRVNRAVLPHLRRRQRGLLVHVSSGAGRVTVPAMAAYCASKYALEALADAYRYELRPFGIESVLVEPGIYRTAIFDHDRLVAPADAERLADYGEQGDYARRVLGTFLEAIGAPDAPGSEEVAETLVRLVEMPPGTRPFRTVVSPPIQQLLEPYNAAAEELRPVVAQIFNVSELADVQPDPRAVAATG
jgi:NAD(P)-dependent dehydrogenase (short-subunit alcohol dehydrogenase family)